MLSIKYFPKIARGSINLKLVKIFYFKHHCSLCLESAGLASLHSYVLCLSSPFPLPVEMFKLEGFKTFWATILGHNFLWKCCSDILQALLKITAAYFKGIPLYKYHELVRHSRIHFFLIKTLKKIFWLYLVLTELKITVQLKWMDNLQFIKVTRKT